MSKPKKGVKIRVSYRIGEGQFPLDEKLDKRIEKAMKSMGARSYGSGSGCGERDLVFELGVEEEVRGA